MVLEKCTIPTKMLNVFFVVKRCLFIVSMPMNYNYFHLTVSFSCYFVH